MKKFSFFHILLSVVVAFSLFIIFTVIKYNYLDDNDKHESVSENVESQEMVENDENKSLVDDKKDYFVDSDVPPTLSEEKTNNEKVEEVNSVVVKVQNVSELSTLITQTLSVSGEVESEHETNLMASMSGNVKEVFIKTGQEVSANSIVVDLTGDEDNQKLLLQQEHLKENISLQQTQVDRVQSYAIEKLKLSLKTLQTSDKDIDIQIQDIKKLNEKSLELLQKQTKDIDDQIYILQDTQDLSQFVIAGNEDKLKDSASSTALSLVNSAWVMFETSAVPLVNIFYDYNDGVSRLKTSIEKSEKEMKGWMEDIESDEIKNDLEELIEDLDEVIEILNDLIEERDNIEIPVDFSSVVSQYMASVSQNISAMRQGISGLLAFEEEFEGFQDNRDLNFISTDAQILQLEQQKKSIAINVDSMLLQQEQSLHGLESQKHQVEGSIKDIEWQISEYSLKDNPEIENMKNQIETMKQQLKEIDAGISAFVITAPFDGLIKDVFVKAGEDVQPGMKIASIMTKQLLVKAFVHTSDINDIFLGQEAKVSLFGDDQVYIANVITISPTADPVSHTVDVELAVSGEFKTVPHSLLDVDFLIQQGDEKGIYIPLSTIISDNQMQYVFVYDQISATAVQVAVETGNVRDDLIEITSGLPANAMLITSGQKFLKNGDVVEVEGLTIPVMENVEQSSGNEVWGKPPWIE